MCITDRKKNGEGSESTSNEPVIALTNIGGSLTLDEIESLKLHLGVHLAKRTARRTSFEQSPFGTVSKTSPEPSD